MNSTCDCECSKACKIDEYIDTKNCSCKKHLSGNLVLKCEDEIFNATENSLDNKKVVFAKNNYFIHTISFITIYLLLLVMICVNC